MDARREALKELQSLKHSSEVKQSVMDNLKDNASHLNVKDAMERLGNLEDKFDAVKAEIDAKLSSISDSIKTREEYDQTVEDTRAQVCRWRTVMEQSLGPCPVMEDFESQMENFKATVSPQVDRYLSRIKELQEESNAKEVAELDKDWTKLKGDFKVFEDKVRAKCGLYAKFQVELASYEAFVTSQSDKLKGVETVALSSEEKVDCSERLKAELEAIEEKCLKLEAFKASEENSCFLEAQSHALASADSKLNDLKGEVASKLSQLEKSLDVHDKFVREFKSVQDWTLESLDALVSIKEEGSGSGSMSELQEQKEELDTLEEELAAKFREYSAGMASNAHFSCPFLI